jgi:hypothetical protein
VECAGDRCCRKRQHIYKFLKFFNAFLVPHPEFVLLIHHEQTEVLKRDISLKQAVRADHHIYGPALESSKRLVLFGFRSKSRKYVDTNRKRREAFRKRAKVLIGKQRRRHEHGSLVSILRGLECGPERDLCFAVSHVPAYNPIHGPRPLHVAKYVLYGFLLVRCFLIGKCALKLSIQIVRRRK